MPCVVVITGAFNVLWTMAGGAASAKSLPALTVLEPPRPAMSATSSFAKNAQSSSQERIGLNDATAASHGGNEISPQVPFVAIVEAKGAGINFAKVVGHGSAKCANLFSALNVWRNFTALNAIETTCGADNVWRIKRIRPARNVVWATRRPRNRT